MEIDIRTIILILGFTHLMQMLVFFYQYKVNKTYNGTGWWLLWSASEILGFALMLFRNNPSLLPLVITFQNPMMVAGTLFLYFGVRRFFDLNLNKKLLISIGVIFLAGHLCFLVFWNDIQMRSIIFSLTLAIVSILTAHCLLSNKSREIAASIHFLASIFLVHSGVFLYRTIMICAGTQVGNFLTPTLFNLLPYFDALIVSLLWTFGFIIMINQRLNTDISEAKKDLQLIFNTSPDAAVITRLDDGKIIDVNEGYSAITGYSHDEIDGRSIPEIKIWKNPADRDIVIDILKEKGFCENYEAVFVRKDGVEITGLMSAKIIFLHGIPHIISITRDITHLKEAEAKIIRFNETLEQRVEERTKQLSLANRELEAFSYSVSHDLRAPIRGMHAFTQILVEDYQDKLDDEGQRICAVIRDNSLKMGRLIDDLIAYSRLGRIDMDLSVIRMKEMVDSIYHEITDARTRDRITLNVDELCQAQADPVMLQQVWSNLLSNAIKYSSKREKTIISISSRIEKGKCIYCIRDNGAGFDMTYLHKIFGVFQRLHSEKDYPGTGVGLAIVQRIIQRHGGEVWAEGEVDKGAAFYFSLPRNSQTD